MLLSFLQHPFITLCLVATDLDPHASPPLGRKTSQKYRMMRNLWNLVKYWGMSHPPPSPYIISCQYNEQEIVYHRYLRLVTRNLIRAQRSRSPKRDMIYVIILVCRQIQELKCLHPCHWLSYKLKFLQTIAPKLRIGLNLSHHKVSISAYLFCTASRS